MKYGQVITDEITTLLAQGMGRVDACSIAGICYDTFREWFTKKPEFSEAIKKAEAQCKQRNIAIIQRAALKTWQAAAWWLERKYRDEFALRIQNVDETSKQEMSKQAVDSAMNVLKMMEEASRNGNAGASPISHQAGMENGAPSVQTKGPTAPSL